MNMKKSIVALVACAALAACAQLTPGTGVANDHALGKNPQDVVFVARGGGNAYGYRAWEVPIGLTFLPWSFPNFESTVKGVRLNLGWGRYAGTYGLDLGTFSEAGDFAGIAVNWCGNVADSATGLQIGFVNHVERMDGVQIGILNFARTQWSVPLVNVCW